MHVTIVCAFTLLAACGGGEKKVESPTVANRGSAAPQAEPPAPTQPTDKLARIIAQYKDFAKEFCACVDRPVDRMEACTRAAGDKFAKANPPTRDDKPSPEEIARFTKETEATTKELTDCATKIGTAVAGSAPATP